MFLSLIIMPQSEVAAIGLTSYKKGVNRVSSKVGGHLIDAAIHHGVCCPSCRESLHPGEYGQLPTRPGVHRVAQLRHRQLPSDHRPARQLSLDD